MIDWTSLFVGFAVGWIVGFFIGIQPKISQPAAAIVDKMYQEKR